MWLIGIKKKKRTIPHVCQFRLNSPNTINRHHPTTAYTALHPSLPPSIKGIQTPIVILITGMEISQGRSLVLRILEKLNPSQSMTPLLVLKRQCQQNI